MPEAPLLLRAARLIDGTGRPPCEPGAIVIEGGRIRAAGAIGSIETPAGALVLDLPDHTLLPGLIDAHYHCSLSGALMNYHQRMADPLPELIVRAATNLRKHLKAGVTTARVLGDHGWMDFALKKAIDAGELPGPRLLPSGLGMRPTHGHGVMGTPTDGTDRIRERTRANLERGAHVIKLFVSGDPIPEDPGPCAYSLAEIQAAVDEAHRYSRRVIAHCYGGLALRHCVEAHVDGIEHGIEMDDEGARLLTESGTWLGLTLNSFLNGKRLHNRYGGQVPERIMKRQERVRANLARALRAGVRWTLGTDAQHGEMAFELEAVVGLGAAPLDAIVAATRRAAESCGVASQTGTLEPGKLADVIAVRGNPIADIKCVWNVDVVIKDGKRWDHISAV